MIRFEARDEVRPEERSFAITISDAGATVSLVDLIRDTAVTVLLLSSADVDRLAAFLAGEEDS